MSKKIHNHLLPRMVIKRWEDEKARIFVKNAILPFSRPVHKYDYSEQYYYSLGKEDSGLEDRISVFEGYIGSILKKINEANDNVILSEKDMEILKLYVVLQSCRNENTSPYINNDETGIYENNKYLIGTPLLSTQKEAVEFTNIICDEFDRIKQATSEEKYLYGFREPFSNCLNSFLCYGLHLIIVRSESSSFIVSETTAVIECTMDSEYLYTFVPVSPHVGLILAKSKYFWNSKVIEETKYRLSLKHGGFRPDSWLSNAIIDNKLIYNGKTKNKSVTLNIVNLSDIETYHLNSVIYEDGKRILFCNEKALELAKTPNPSRNVFYNF